MHVGSSHATQCPSADASNLLLLPQTQSNTFNQALANWTKNATVTATMSTGINFTYTAVAPSYGTYGNNLTWPLVSQIQGIGRSGGSANNLTRMVLSDVSAQYQGSAGERMARPPG